MSTIVERAQNWIDDAWLHPSKNYYVSQLTEMSCALVAENEARAQAERERDEALYQARRAELERDENATVLVDERDAALAALARAERERDRALDAALEYRERDVATRGQGEQLVRAYCVLGEMLTKQVALQREYVILKDRLDRIESCL